MTWAQAYGQQRVKPKMLPRHKQEPGAPCLEPKVECRPLHHSLTSICGHPPAKSTARNSEGSWNQNGFKAELGRVRTLSLGAKISRENCLGCIFLNDMSLEFSGERGIPGAPGKVGPVGPKGNQGAESEEALSRDVGAVCNEMREGETET